MMGQPIIQFEHISKAFAGQPVLRDLSLSIEAGEFVTVIGRSGCGKTTLLRLINRLITPDQGCVMVQGQDVAQTDPIALRRRIGYAIQSVGLFPHMTVEKNISYVPNLLNKKDKARTKAAVSKWMKIVGLDESIKDRYPSELSGGQQQRVGIARALAASPTILLMDEPFGAVDEITRGQLQSELKRIHEQTHITILFVTHDISEALKLGTKVLVMDKGVIQQYAAPTEVLRNPATDFVKQLVYRERHTCNLPEEQLKDCKFSGAGNGE